MRLNEERRAAPEFVTAIVATYNRPDALAAVLRGLDRQSIRDFEVIVADDGSTPATGALVRDQAAHFSVPLKHVWHEDRGFRLAEIRNRAILASEGSYCIFLDGDCVPRPRFIAAHRRLAQPGRFVAGNRVLLSQSLTSRILTAGEDIGSRSFVEWAWLRAQGDINRLAPLVTLPLGPLRRLQGHSWRSARGGNLAIWKSDLLAVDGFDANFRGWGREDSDIILRLMRNGVQRKDGRFATGVIHLWHPENDRSQLADNDRRLAELGDSERVRAVTGLSGLVPAARLRRSAGGA
jgi:glycosyltransferase involved in cell wall biosynthesis